jgi:hypothetical protein
LFEVRKFENAAVFSVGFVGGAGVEIPVLKHRNVHLEVKYIKSPGMDFQDMSIALSGTFFSAGFNL